MITYLKEDFNSYLKIFQVFFKKTEKPNRKNKSVEVHCDLHAFLQAKDLFTATVKATAEEPAVTLAKTTNQQESNGQTITT